MFKPLIFAIWLLRFGVYGHELVRDIQYVIILVPIVAYLHHDELGWNQPVSLSHMILALIITALYIIVAAVVRTSIRSKTPAPTGDIPYLLPCQTAHARLFPKKHAFAYSYLQVAIPVGWQGAIGSLVSIDQPEAWTWFAIRSRDYLARGSVSGGLKAKLEEYLRSQDVDPMQYDSVWLVTSPRFLGYAFNPVSFWYLYKGKTLTAMILEVNNTFDERRPYFLPHGYGIEKVSHSMNARPDTASCTVIDMTAGMTVTNHSSADVSTSPTPKFAARWQKDFHVSPFNSRKGAYQLAAQIPEFANGIGIANTITLRSSKQHVKLVARLYSTAPPLSTVNLSTLRALGFVGQWCAVGFITYPRIVWQAARLFFRSKLHVWYRPEVAPTSIGRNETRQEGVVEASFRAWLGHCAQHPTNSNVALNYTASGNALPRRRSFATWNNCVDNKASKEISLIVLTPLFYAQVATASDVAVYLRHNAAQAEEARTFACSDLEALLAWLVITDTDNLKPSSTSRPSNALSHFAATQIPSSEARRYMQAVRTLKWANRCTAGYTEVVDAAICVARVLVATWVVRTGMRAAVLGLAPIHGPFTPMNITSS